MKYLVITPYTIEGDPDVDVIVVHADSAQEAEDRAQRVSDAWHGSYYLGVCSAIPFDALMSGEWSGDGEWSESAADRFRRIQSGAAAEFGAALELR